MKIILGKTQLKLEQETDMHISELKQSKFLTKHDVEPPIRVTITGITSDNLAKEGEPEEMKHILLFKECKPLVLNTTNGQLIAHVLGSEETDDWVNKQVVLWNDPSVSFGGQMTGGVRVQVPQAQPAAQTDGAAPTGGFEDMQEPNF